MRYVRTPVSTDAPFALDAVKLHARVDHDDDDTDLDMMGYTAAAEVEAYCDIALLAQIITAEFDRWSDVVHLPVGPFYAAGATANPVKIHTRGDDGTLTEHPGAGWIMPGRYPRLHLTEKLTGKSLVIEYPAGFGAAVSAIPADLLLAVTDHAGLLYDRRTNEVAPQGLSLAAARICARHRRVKV